MEFLSERAATLPSLALLGLSVIALGADPPAANPSVALEDLSPDDAASLAQAYDTARRSMRPADGGHRADHPGQRWRTFFDGRGFRVEPDGGGWTWGLELESWGFAGSEQRVSGHAAATARGDRLTYAWDEALEEWYVNGEGGLEHGFTVHDRPPRGDVGLLTFTLAVRGELRPRVDAGGRGIRFVDGTGAVALTYTGLVVFDADGRELDAGFESVSGAVRLTIDEAGARYPLTIDPTAQQAYLKASNTGSDDEFGVSVAISGDTAVVGARWEDSAATGVDGDQGNDDALSSGAAYVFVRTGTSWSQQAYLKASNTDSGDLFGTSVAVSGDTIVVGAPYEDSAATGVNGDQDDDDAQNAGAAYVFLRSGSSWTQQAYLKASNGGLPPGELAGDSFGGAVAIAGDTIVVGAVEEDSSATGVDGDEDDNGSLASGAAYVFVREGTSWSQEAYLKASNTGASDRFGTSVAISGDTVAIGVPSEDSIATGVDGDQGNDDASASGAVYVFVRNGTSWSQQAYLKASNTEAFDGFGIAVAISGERILVGARGEDSGARGVDGPQNNAFTYEGSGAAYLFGRTGTSWSQQAYLKASNTGGGDQFGESVAISGDRAVVCAPGEASSATGFDGDAADDSADGAGAAYLFVHDGAGWAPVTYLKASNTGSDDAFGSSVGLSGDTVILAALGEDSPATGVNGGQGNGSSDSGAAYVFSLSSALGTAYCAPVPNSTGSPGRLMLFGSAEVADDELLLRATSLPVLPGPGVNLGYFLMGTGTNSFTPPGSIGPLCIAPGLLRYLPPPQNTEELVGGFERVVGTSGPVSGAITAASTWNFQAWYRDGAAFTSNFTEAVTVTFE